nr:hypothetical protein [Neobacillus sp. Marseille-Q6967]
MINKELLVSIFKKELGGQKVEINHIYESQGVLSFIFSYKNARTIKILLIETESNQWVIHHEVSKESPFLSKKIVQVCERVERIIGDKDLSISLSEDLIEIRKQPFIITALKSGLQNYLSKHFILFGVHNDREERRNNRIQQTERRYVNEDL